MSAMRMLKNLALTAVVLALGAAFAQAQSLVEVAKKEKERRNKNKAEASRVITDRELTSSYGGLPPATSSTSTTQAAEGEETSSSTGAEQGENKEGQDETKTQEYWQNRVKTSKDKIAKLEQQLQSDDWGEGQRVGVDPRGQNNLGQRQQVEQQLTAARQELEAIRGEARRAGVPPGWVR